MKKFFVIALALALTAGAAYANYCARDYVPAATLLVPYAVVDMIGSTPDPNGYSTLLTVTNVSSDAQLIHITVWSALSEPIVDWDEVLTGYDVWNINFRDMLTGHFDYFDTGLGTGFWSGSASTTPVTPFGPATNNGWATTLTAPRDVEQVWGNGTCYFPYGYHPEYGTGIVAGLRADIFAPAYQYYCAAQNPRLVANYVDWQINIDPDDALFFYVTVDAVDFCSTNFPNSAAYWASGTIPDEDNVLLGEVYYINFTANLSEAIPAVHLEYDPQAANNPNISTFYELAVGGVASVYDGLEPLATAFAFRYYNSGGISSNLMLWKSQYEFTPYYWDVDACGHYAYYAWDENEKSRTRSGGPSGFDRPEPNVIPFETQKVPMTQSNWTGLMSGNGWMLLVFDPSLDGQYAPTSPGIEAWAGVQHNFGGFSAALEAATMANYWCFNQQQLGGPFYLGVNFNYTDGDVPLFQF